MPKRARARVTGAGKKQKMQRGQGRAKKTMKGGGIWEGLGDFATAFNGVVGLGSGLGELTAKYASRLPKAIMKGGPGLALGALTRNPYAAAQGFGEFAGEEFGDDYNFNQGSMGDALNTASMYAPGGYFGRKLGRAKQPRAQNVPAAAPVENKIQAAPLGDRISGRQMFRERAALAANNIRQRARAAVGRFADRSRAIGQRVGRAASGAAQSLVARARDLRMRLRNPRNPDLQFGDNNIEEPLLGQRNPYYDYN